MFIETFGISTYLLIIAFALAVVFLIALITRATYMVNQAEVIIIERLGKFHSILHSGLHFVIPFVDRPRKILWSFVKDDARGKASYRFSEFIERIDLRESLYDFTRQNVITRDNVTMEINALLYFQITDPKCAAYEVNNVPHAIEKLAQTTLRNIIGSLTLDETLTSRDRINEKLRHVLDDATDKWGVKVNRVELQEVNPPADIRAAMEKEMRAERDRRALILEAEGKKSSAILEAEGLKNAAILSAEGERQARIVRAQGEAEARLTLAAAEAETISIMYKAVPGKQDILSYLIAMNYIKMLPEITKDKNGKMMVVPYEATALMGSLGTIKELFSGTTSTIER